MSLVREITTVDTILKQLEYVTNYHIAMQTILFKFKTALFFSSFYVAP